MATASFPRLSRFIAAARFHFIRRQNSRWVRIPAAPLEQAETLLAARYDYAAAMTARVALEVAIKSRAAGLEGYLPARPLCDVVQFMHTEGLVSAQFVRRARWANRTGSRAAHGQTLNRQTIKKLLREVRELIETVEA